MYNMLASEIISDPCESVKSRIILPQDLYPPLLYWRGGFLYRRRSLVFRRSFAFCFFRYIV